MTAPVEGSYFCRPWMARVLGPCWRLGLSTFPGLFMAVILISSMSVARIERSEIRATFCRVRRVGYSEVLKDPVRRPLWSPPGRVSQGDHKGRPYITTHAPSISPLCGAG